MPYRPQSPRTVDHRLSASDRGYGRRWRVARRQWLKRHPLCVLCEADGRVVAAEVVDHITPHRGNRDAFWNQENWQSLCKQCHDRKTRGGE